MTKYTHTHTYEKTGKAQKMLNVVWRVSVHTDALCTQNNGQNFSRAIYRHKEKNMIHNINVPLQVTDFSIKPLVEGL